MIALLLVILLLAAGAVALGFLVSAGSWAEKTRGGRGSTKGAIEFLIGLAALLLALVTAAVLGGMVAG